MSSSNISDNTSRTLSERNQSCVSERPSLSAWRVSFAFNRREVIISAYTESLNLRTDVKLKKTSTRTSRQAAENQLFEAWDDGERRQTWKGNKVGYLANHTRIVGKQLGFHWRKPSGRTEGVEILTKRVHHQRCPRGKRGSIEVWLGSCPRVLPPLRIIAEHFENKFLVGLGKHMISSSPQCSLEQRKQGIGGYGAVAPESYIKAIVNQSLGFSMAM
ncbi:hypothetical protein K438DRAFT_1746785 [Mycena galopus ATCC 62051]|nr:hypothetical protein K438DRAFT_1746785 [Mycena galopus ATCC 62051]